jgi:hypothetical protein
MMKVAAFRTLGNVVFALIYKFIDHPIEKVASLLDLITNTRQIHQPEWCAIFFIQILE